MPPKVTQKEGPDDLVTEHLKKLQQDLIKLTSEMIDETDEVKSKEMEAKCNKLQNAIQTLKGSLIATAATDRTPINMNSGSFQHSKEVAHHLPNFQAFEKFKDEPDRFFLEFETKVKTTRIPFQVAIRLFGNLIAKAPRSSTFISQNQLDIDESPVKSIEELKISFMKFFLKTGHASKRHSQINTIFFLLRETVNEFVDRYEQILRLNNYEGDVTSSYISEIFIIYYQSRLNVKSVLRITI